MNLLRKETVNPATTKSSFSSKGNKILPFIYFFSNDSSFGGTHSHNAPYSVLFVFWSSFNPLQLFKWRFCCIATLRKTRSLVFLVHPPVLALSQCVRKNWNAANVLIYTARISYFKESSDCA